MITLPERLISELFRNIFINKKRGLSVLILKILVKAEGNVKCFRKQTMWKCNKTPAINRYDGKVWGGFISRDML